MNMRSVELIKELSRLQADSEQVRQEAKREGRTNVEIYAKGAEGAYADALARVTVALPTIIAEAMEKLEEPPGVLVELYGR